jgi:epoxyqueuosine reductase
VPSPGRTPAAELRPLITDLARAAGFEAVGFARLADLGSLLGDRLAAFVAAGEHGTMHWMAETLARRRHPNAMWAESRSAIVLGLSYAPERDPLANLAVPERGVVSCYAKGRDYHDVVKGKLKQVAGTLHRRTGADVKVFVDTAPLLEKPLAALAGLGWQGKHTNLVSRRHGSWLFLGVVLTTLELEPDAAATDRCGSCRRCLVACPTDAFPAPYRLDARRCIAYLTIEHAGPIPHAFRAALGNRIYGCDDCLAVCPWNKFAEKARETRLAARPEIDDPPLADLLALDDAAFRRRFAGTAIKRIGRDRLVRNVAIAAGNSGDPALVPLIEALLADAAPIVRGAAVWALARLLARDPAAFEALAHRHRAAETDPGVRAEWQAA